MTKTLTALCISGVCAPSYWHGGIRQPLFDRTQTARCARPTRLALASDRRLDKLRGKESPFGLAVPTR